MVDVCSRVVGQNTYRPLDRETILASDIDLLQLLGRSCRSKRTKRGPLWKASKRAEAAGDLVTRGEAAAISSHSHGQFHLITPRHNDASISGAQPAGSSHFPLTFSSRTAVFRGGVAPQSLTDNGRQGAAEKQRRKRRLALRDQLLVVNVGIWERMPLDPQLETKR